MWVVEKEAKLQRVGQMSFLWILLSEFKILFREMILSVLSSYVHHFYVSYQPGPLISLGKDMIKKFKNDMIST